MDNTQLFVPDNYNEIIAESRRKIKEILHNTITDDVKNDCPGMVIIPLSIDEFMTLKRLLSESSERKIQDARRARDRARRNELVHEPQSGGLILNIIRET